MTTSNQPIRESKALDNSTVKQFELEKYLGVWHEITRYNHRFEKGLSNVMAEYILQDNGSIKVVNTGFDTKLGKRKEVIGKAKTTATPGLLRVSFFWIFYSDYRILELDDNYEWALVSAGGSDKFLWILSREETLPEETINIIISKAKNRGFDNQRLMFE